jgi:hypothetical protein
MEISKRIRHEHAELRSLAQSILNQSDADQGRERNFTAYDHQLREHLDLFEAFFLKRMKEDAVVKDSVADIKSEHALVRKELKGLNRSDKDGHQWSTEFRRFTERFEHLCHRHDALVAHAEASGRSESLDREYEATKAKQMRGLFAPSGGRGSTTAMVVGAAAAAGAAYFLSRYFKGGSPLASRRLGRRGEWTGKGETVSGTRPDTEVSASAAIEAKPAFGFDGAAPDTDGARTAPNPATAPSASGIIIN